MKIRNREEAAKIEPQMAPMIDVVFQLLIFFMLTLKIIPQEGDFDINMPLGQAPQSSSSPLDELQKLVLETDGNGNLVKVSWGQTVIAAGIQPGDDAAIDAAFAIVREKAQKGSRAQGDSESEVTIDADYNLDFAWTTRGIGAVMGTLKQDGDNVKVVRYFEKVKFDPPD